MRLLPKSGREWLSLVLFPFKVYTVLAVFAVFIWGAALPRHSQSSAIVGAGILILFGYSLSAIVLFVGGLIQASAGPRGAGLISLLFAGAALIIAFRLAPMFAFAWGPLLTFRRSEWLARRGLGDSEVAAGPAIARLRVGMSKQKSQERIERRKRFGLLAVCVLVAPVAAMILFGAIADFRSGNLKIGHNLYYPDQPVGPLFRLIGSAVLLSVTLIFMWRLVRSNRGDRT